LGKHFAINFHSDVGRLMEKFELDMSEPTHEWKAEFLPEALIDVQQTGEAREAGVVDSSTGHSLPPPRLRPESGLSSHMLPSWFRLPDEIETLGSSALVHLGLFTMGSGFRLASS
jgi:hypothetical protein